MSRNHCDVVIDITNGSLEDVIEIDAASKQRCDEIREIRDINLCALGSNATYKVYNIDRVHMLSTECLQCSFKLWTNKSLFKLFNFMFTYSLSLCCFLKINVLGTSCLFVSFNSGKEGL